MNWMQRPVGTLPGSLGRQIAGFAIACVLGAGLHAALTIGEMWIRRDTTYGQVMQPERERVIERELAAWQRDQQARGVEPTPAAQREQKLRIEDDHPRFPFVIILAVATLIAVVAGARRSPRRSTVLTNGLVARVAAVAVAAIWFVILIDGLIS